MIVAHNLTAMGAMRQFNLVYGSKAKSTEKLSSGYRINRSADDAAGLAISEKMRRQIRGLNKATENIQDGISFVQVADGALDEVSDMLQRINQLAVKSANATNSEDDRRYIDEEVQQLKKEINRVFSDTAFNEERIWDEERIPISTTVVTDSTTMEYPAVVFNSMSAYSYTNNLNKGAMAETAFSIKADDIGMKMSWTGYNGTKYETNNIPWPTTLKGTHSFKLSDYMDYSKYPEAAGVDFEYKYTVNQYSTKQQVIDAFNQSTSSVGGYISNGVNASSNYADGSGVKIVNAGAAIDYDAMLAAGKDFNAFDGAFINFVSMNNPALTAVDDSTKFSFKFNMPGIGNVTANFSSGYYTGSYNSDLKDRTGENIWWKENTRTNGTKYKSTLSYSIDGSLDSIAKAITNTDGHSLWKDNISGGGVSMSFSLTADTPYTCADGKKSSSVGSMTISFSVDKSKASSEAGLVSYITDALANFNGVTITDNDGSSQGYLRTYRTSDSKSSIKASHTFTSTHEEHEYLTTNDRDIYIQSGTEQGHGIHIQYDNLNTELLGIKDTNVRTAEAAGNAINEVKKALAKVSEQRSNFGAYQNRLEHSMKINQNVAENTTAAESAIRDTDMAKEAMQSALKDVISQAGIAMMSQANQSNQGVLSLLQ